LRIDGRDVLLDGAHNPAGATALAIALDDLRPFMTDGPLTLVTASMADKDVAGVIRALAAAAALVGASVVCTSLDLARSMPAADLARLWKAALPAGRISAEADYAAALDRAIAQPAAHGPLIVAGSLYLVGAARARWVDDPDLRDPLRDPSPDPQRDPSPTGSP
jgi:dihydrofolate synthase/folylpolyglutamate synthase